MQESTCGIEFSKQSPLRKRETCSRSDSGSFSARFREAAQPLPHRASAKRSRSVQAAVPTREFPYAIPLPLGGGGGGGGKPAHDAHRHPSMTASAARKSMRPS